MSDIVLDDLSFDAKAVAGGWFGLMVPGKGELTFELVSQRPSDRAQAALDEMVRAGMLAVEPNRAGGLVYTPLVSCRPALRWLQSHIDNPEIKFALVEPLKDQAEAAVVRKAALLAGASA